MKVTQRGVSMLEVLIAMVVFAIGLLAIASLQGELLRSSGDAKTRTVAVNLAQDKLEELRGFSALQGDCDAGADTYNCIGPSEEPEVVTDLQDLYGESAEGGFLGSSFEREWTVSEHYFGEEDSKLIPDYIKVDVTVSWEDGSGEENSVTVGDMIAAVAPSDSTGTVGGLLEPDSPEVDYKLIAATEDITAVPVLEFEDEEGNTRYQETWRLADDTVMDKEVRRIEVIHFTNDPFEEDDEFRSVRSREEFLTAACDCSVVGSGQGKTPALWTGNAAENPFISGEFAEKTVGSANDGTTLCTRCCRDHHDLESTYDHDGREVTDAIHTAFDPFRDQGGVFSAIHEHFSNDDSLVAPIDSGDYLEACRFVRKDGFFEVVRDFYLVDIKVINVDSTADTAPENEVTLYSDYAREYLDEFMREVLENGDLDYPRELPNPDNFSAEFQSLESQLEGPLQSTEHVQVHGIYVDYLDPVVQNVIACRQGGGENCEDLGISEGPALESLPFQVLDLTQFVNLCDEGPFTEQNPPEHVELPEGSGADEEFYVLEASVGRSNSALAPGGVPIDPDDESNLARNERLLDEDSPHATCG